MLSKFSTRGCRALTVVAIRYPHVEVAQDLVNSLGKQISANLFSKVKSALATAFGGGCHFAPALA